MRPLYAGIALAALILTPATVTAQWLQPAGVTGSVQARRRARAFLHVLPPRATSDTTASSTRASITPPQQHPWRWVGVGALVGMIGGAAAATVAVSHTDDAFFPGLALGVTAVAGLTAGGVLGGLAYLVSH